MIINRISFSTASLLIVCLRRFEGRWVNPMVPEIYWDTTFLQTNIACAYGGCSVETHQIGAHGALCQHERTFRHQENLNVGKTRGFLLVVILLRVVGAAPLCADLVFNLHPLGSGSGLVGRHETERVRSGGEHLVIMTSCTAGEVRISLSIARLGWNIQREILLSTQHYAQSVCDLASPPVQPVRIGYIIFKYVGYACICMTASDTRRRTTGRSFPTSGMLNLHPGPVPTGFGFSARFRDAALRPSGGVITLLLLLLLPSINQSTTREVYLSLCSSLHSSLSQRVSQHHHFTCADFHLHHCHKNKMQHFIIRKLTEASSTHWQINWISNDTAHLYWITNDVLLCYFAD